MLTIEGTLKFYFLPYFKDMRFKHDRICGIVREQLQREPREGDVYMIMSSNRRIVRFFAFEEHSVALFEKKFHRGYKFMKIVDDNGEISYRIRWEDVKLILGSPVIKELRINKIQENKDML